MIRRTSRKRLIRSGAFALVAVVLPAAECWASWADDSPVTSPDGSEVATASASDDAKTDATPSRRFKLPALPRPFRARRQALSAVKFPSSDAGRPDAQASPVQAAPPPPAVPAAPPGMTTVQPMPAPPSPSLPPPTRTQAAQAAVAALNYAPAVTAAAAPVAPPAVAAPAAPVSAPPSFNAAPASTAALNAASAPSSAFNPPPGTGAALNTSAASGPAILPQAPRAAPGAWDIDPGVERTGCATCGGFHSMQDGAAFHASFGCSDGMCIPGRAPCNSPAICCDTFVGEFLNNLYQCLCCPDPCYQPGWVPAANASFFADYARPWTVTRIRFDRGLDMVRPDRNQFFLMKTNPKLPTRAFPLAGGMFRLAMDPSLNFSQVSLYQEAAGERGSLFVEYPYRQINPLFSPTNAGFGDINFGIKSLLFDCEMLQVAFQFRTYAPTGNAMAGLGTGHFSLEPSILASLKLAADTYYQIQVAQWIPLGGSAHISGGVLYWLMSLNQVLWWCTPNSPLIGTLEMDGWSFQNGGWTVPLSPVGGGFVGPPGSHRGVINSGGGVSYFNIGPGLRMSLCNRVDFGGAITWATTSAHWADPWFRFEVRFLF